MCLSDLFSIAEASGLPDATAVDVDDIEDPFQPIPGFDLETRPEAVCGRYPTPVWNVAVLQLEKIAIVIVHLGASLHGNPLVCGKSNLLPRTTRQSHDH